MRFHVLGLPQIGTTRDYYVVGFAPTIVYFCRILMGLGHEVFLYTSDENEAPCTEAVQVMTAAEQKRWLGGTLPVFAPFELSMDMWSETSKRMAEAIGKRKQPHDFICTLGGTSQKAALDPHPDLMAVEYSVGYLGTCCKYRVFQTHAWRQYIYGKDNADDSRFWDATIPRFFDVSEFPFQKEKEPYVLYCGRITPRKGIQIAVEASARAGMPLKLIGPGMFGSLPKHCEHLGVVSNEERVRLLGGATAVLAPTLYNEPFNAVVIEANLCGTPSITTDWGSFPELIENGVNGWRCNLLGEFEAAIKKARTLNPATIRERAIARYSLEAVGPQFQSYFERLSALWEKGWYT